MADVSEVVGNKATMGTKVSMDVLIKLLRYLKPSILIEVKSVVAERIKANVPTTSYTNPELPKSSPVEKMDKPGVDAEVLKAKANASDVGANHSQGKGGLGSYGEVSSSQHYASPSISMPHIVPQGPPPKLNASNLTKWLF